MQIVDIVKTAATTINGLIAIGCFAGSLYCLKENKDKAPTIALLVMTILFVANAIIVWI